ncbi:hypothetical protein PENSPDRAFT_659107 [Peniophora sp. CONT]|nr:hypothetical protein PENSPDRAFT_659107 [Peniophora sp. CONT]
MPVTHRGYEVHIESDGKELPQFQVEVLDERTVTCWIPSEAGKSFLMRYATVGKHPYETMSASLYADGRALSGHGGLDKGKSSLRSQSINGVGIRPFVFSDVVLAPGEEEEGAPAPLLKDIGVIEVTFSSATKKSRRVKSGGWFGATVEDAMTLSERSKLVGINHVKLGDVVPTTLVEPSHGWIPTGKPYAIFRFKHRPTNVLQAMGIMPRPARLPTPPIDSYPPSEPAARPENAGNTNLKRSQKEVEEKEDVKSSASSVSLAAKRRRIQAEIAAEEAEAAARQARAALLRAQLDEDEANLQTTSVPVKSERAPPPINVPRSGEVIDLTDE